MSSYRPPLENVAIFDSVLFIDGDDFLTQNQADSRYLRYPVAQGTETLQAINVNGTATFAGTSDIIQQSGSQLLQQPASTGYVGTGNVLNQTFISTNNGATTTPSLQVTDVVQANKTILAVPNASSQAFNPIVTAGDSVLTSGSAPLTLTRGGLTNSVGLRIGLSNSLSVVLGAGGTSNTPSNSITINGTTNTSTIIGTTLQINNTNVSFGSTTPPTSAQTIPAANDSSTKIPTTAWVQSAITAGSSNITPNSINITPTTALLTYTAGINNLYNMGAFYALSGSTTQLYNNTTSPVQYTPTRPIQIQFTTADGTNNFNLTQPVTFTLNCFFYDGSSYGETSCQLMLFPAALTSNWGSFGALNYNINNNINGNTGFYSAGRQYWTSNQQLSGFSGSQGWLQGVNNATGVYTIYIYFTMWTASTWTYWIRSQAVNGATTASPQMGIEIFS